MPKKLVTIIGQHINIKYGKTNYSYYVGHLSSGGNYCNSYLESCNSTTHHFCTGNSAYGNILTFGFRPVFTLKPELKLVGGDGTTVPYTLEK